MRAWVLGAAATLVVAGCATGGGHHAQPVTEPTERGQTGYASYYARHLHGARTASGERYDADALTAAHRTLAFGTRVRVTNLENGRSVVVTVTDRGPHRKGRIIDLSRAAARKLDFLEEGTTRVRVEVVDDP
jgi:rare lipoprotein A